MNYHEAIETDITRAMAIREIELHNLEPGDFFEEVGDQETYSGKLILDWLGY